MQTNELMKSNGWIHADKWIHEDGWIHEEKIMMNIIREQKEKEYN